MFVKRRFFRAAGGALAAALALSSSGALAADTAPTSGEADAAAKAMADLGKGDIAGAHCGCGTR